MRYVCLLRGINVGGKNRVVMAELRTCFEALGFSNVSTYINSGNVIFESHETDVIKLIDIIETQLERDLIKLRVTVVSVSQLEKNIHDAPVNWGTDKTHKHNLLFVRPPQAAADVMAAFGVTKPDIETIVEGEGVVYWSANLEYLGRTASSKLIGSPIYKEVTIRNYNTSIKLLALMQQKTTPQ